ncbi:MAG: L,D-transpeptidase family protein [Chloroflexi bacterium]|nr:L,D-transpeptidase family protein [Chloroflexota bacterium]
MTNLPFSRRDFLKLFGAGLLGAFFAELRLDRALAMPATQGRVILSGLKLYKEPSFNAAVLRVFPRDEIVTIAAEVSGDNGPKNPYNNHWYQIEDGYVYSGWVQPTETVYQPPVFEIPSTGQLGEVTVPFSDTRLSSSLWAKKGYRIYYRTTHWVTGTAINRYEKTIWYVLYDRYLQESFYMPAHEMRLVPAEELAPLSPDVPEETKRIYVDLPTQMATAFEGDTPVLATRISSGGKGTPTPSGKFFTFHKGSTVHMSNQGNASENIYHLPGVPWVSFFTGSGDAFHGTFWHNDYGRPQSRGCVNMTPDDSKFIYRWTRPVVPPEQLIKRRTYAKTTFICRSRD